jgi:acyl-CoA synthetase (NDP forming)
MHSLVHQRRLLKREALRESLPVPIKTADDACPSKVCSEIFNRVRDEGRTLLTLREAREVFEAFEIPLNRWGMAASEDETEAVGSEIGFPVAMKISSKDIVHKTEAGGVMLNIHDAAEAKAAYEQIIKNVKAYNPDAKIEGVEISQMIKGPEIIIGVSSDPQFGQMVMFGLGGTMVEVYRDVSFRLIPLMEIDAMEMIHEIRGKHKFMGARGGPAADLTEMAKLIVKVADAVRLHPDIAELDINPLVVTEKGLIAIDSRILIREKAI